MEARSTVAGVLSGELFGEPAPGDERFEGILSLVVGEPFDGVKPLPKLHFGRREVFADRSLENVTQRLERIGRSIVQASERPTYMLQPCRYGDQMGLYAKDFFNRSKFRFELRREGFSFADDPFVRLAGDGMLECDDWGRYEPRFVIYNAGANPPEPQISRGRMVFILTTFKLGSPTPWDVIQLQNVTRSSIAVPGVDVGTVTKWVDREHG